MEADKYQELALRTWYAPDSPLYLAPRHPLIKLAGEAGEILDLYGKDQFKPGVSWLDCKTCGQWVDDIFHGQEPHSHDYIPKVLDELGDWWYYVRIVTYQHGISVADWIAPAAPLDNILLGLSEINLRCARMLSDYVAHGVVNTTGLRMAFNWFCGVLLALDCTLDRLTELNYKKLNSEPTAHGWKGQVNADTPVRLEE